MAVGRNTSQGRAGDPDLALGPAALACLMPMFLWLMPDGTARDAGPTLRKLFRSDPVGWHLRDLFQLRRPRDLSGADEVRELAGNRPHLQLVEPPMTGLRGIVMELAGEQGC